MLHYKIIETEYFLDVHQKKIDEFLKEIDKPNNSDPKIHTSFEWQPNVKIYLTTIKWYDGAI